MLKIATIALLATTTAPHASSQTLQTRPAVQHSTTARLIAVRSKAAAFRTKVLAHQRQKRMKRRLKRIDLR